jgi:hypothetical protein
MLLFSPPIYISRTGWPDWANFRPLGNCFLRAKFWKLYAEVDQIFTTVKVKHYFWQKWVGIDLGSFFQKHVWAPCSRIANINLMRFRHLRPLELSAGPQQLPQLSSEVRLPQLTSFTLLWMLDQVAAPSPLNSIFLSSIVCLTNSCSMHTCSMHSFLNHYFQIHSCSRHSFEINSCWFYSLQIILFKVFLQIDSFLFV